MIYANDKTPQIVQPPDAGILGSTFFMLRCKMDDYTHFMQPIWNETDGEKLN